ncbi:MAG: putative beta-lysine N-acetyltransferase [Armatimonadota bacterium]
MYLRHKLPADAEIVLDERNRRIQLIECGHDPAETVVAAVELADKHGLEKIWGFVAPITWSLLLQVGFKREGTLDRYFDDGMPGIAVARYLTGERAHSAYLEKEDAIVDQANAQASQNVPPLPLGYRMRMATPDDTGLIANLLTSVNEAYPTPIDSATDILTAMTRDVHFAVITYHDAMVGVASADIDFTHRVAEMTDCSIDLEHRGQGLMAALLHFLEREIHIIGLRSVFTLTRAVSIPSNMTFACLGYVYRGRLINNCHIAGDWEDMNLWVKPLT